MRGEAKCAHSRAHVLIIIPLVQAHPLRSLLRRRRSGHDDALDRCAHQLHIAACRLTIRRAHGHAMLLGQHRPCDRVMPAFPRSVRMGGRFPPSGTLVIDPSILNQSQSMLFSSSNRSTPTCHGFRNTPAATHSRHRSSAVDVAHRSVAFNAAHGPPVRRTYKMASAQRRSETRGRPPPNRWTFIEHESRGGSSTARRSSRCERRSWSCCLVWAHACA